MYLRSSTVNPFLLPLSPTVLWCWCQLSLLPFEIFISYLTTKLQVKELMWESNDSDQLKFLILSVLKNSYTTVKCGYWKDCPLIHSSGFQTAQFLLHNKMNGFNPDTKNGNSHRPMVKYYHLPRHSVAHLKVAILQQEEFKGRFQHEATKSKLMEKFDTIFLTWREPL